MSNYTMITDSSCDIAPKTLKKWGVKRVELSFRFQDSSHEYTNKDMPAHEFYNRMREGKAAFTSAANTEVFRELFEEELKAGRDVLYLGFSSGLSSTVNNAKIAATELQETYPERELRVVDTLCASAGFGLLLYLTVKERDKGASLSEVAEFAERTVPHLCHWFTVDDLVYLKRGGRVDAAAAFVAAVLNIKPVLHMDDEGHLINVSKVRGRKAAIRALADRYTELCEGREDGTYFISHGDCEADAQALDEIIFERHGCHATLICDVGPVIGAHSGPGTLALFFLGAHR